MRNKNIEIIRNVLKKKSLSNFIILEINNPLGFSSIDIEIECNIIYYWFIRKSLEKELAESLNYQQKFNLKRVKK